MTRKRLATTGDRGALVRLFLEERGGVKKYVVQYGAKDARKQDSWPFTKVGKTEAEAFFKAFQAEQERKPEEKHRITVRELWKAYLAAEEEHLRPNTRRLYAEAWRRWEQFITPDSIADDLTITQIHDYRKALDARGLATATVQDAIRNVRIAYNWGERMELLERNRWHLFVHKVSKEKRTKQRAEYRSDEFLAIWRALDPADRWQWRAWVAVGLLGIYGNRQTELLSMRWSWIDGDLVTIDPAHVKTGEEGALTLFPLTRGILDVARHWAEEEGYKGEYVLFSGQNKNQRVAVGTNVTKKPHYTLGSLTAAIHRAEKRGGVEKILWRAGHGFRRGLVGDLITETGDATLALHAIGDRDIKMLTHYHAKRRDKIDTAIQSRASKFSAQSGATKVQPKAENNEAPSETPDGANAATSHTSTTYSDN